MSLWDGPERPSLCRIRRRRAANDMVPNAEFRWPDPIFVYLFRRLQVPGGVCPLRQVALWPDRYVNLENHEFDLDSIPRRAPFEAKNKALALPKPPRPVSPLFYLVSITTAGRGLDVDKSFTTG